MPTLFFRIIRGEDDDFDDDPHQHDDPEAPPHGMIVLNASIAGVLILLAIMRCAWINCKIAQEKRRDPESGDTPSFTTLCCIFMSTFCKKGALDRHDTSRSPLIASSGATQRDYGTTSRDPSNPDNENPLSVNNTPQESNRETTESRAGESRGTSCTIS